MSSGGSLEAVGVPLTEFMKLARIPIIVFYGDNIPEKPMANPGQDSWRVRLEMARLWRDAPAHKSSFMNSGRTRHARTSGGLG